MKHKTDPLIWTIASLIAIAGLESRSDGETNAIVCKSSAGILTAAELVGANCEEWTRLRTRHFAFGDFGKLLQQTEMARRREWFAGSDLESLVKSIKKREESLYDSEVKGRMTRRLMEEFVLRRETSPNWYYDQRKMRAGIEYASQLWSAEARLWESSLAGMSAVEFEDGLLKSYKSYPPIGVSTNGLEQSIKEKVRLMDDLRRDGRLESYVTSRRLQQPSNQTQGDQDGFVRSHWFSAELYNWWTHYLFQRAGKYLERISPEAICRPMIPRTMVVARVERAEDGALIERLVKSLGSGDEWVDWTGHRQVVGFGEEFGFTNRYLMSLEVTNGALLRLVGPDVVLPRRPLEMPPVRVAAGFWFDIFKPRLGAGKTNSGAVWTPVEMTVEGWEWLKTKGGKFGDDRKSVRVWIGPERESDSGRWLVGAENLIRTKVIDMILTDDLKPALAKFMGEFEYRNPRYFPTVDEVAPLFVPSHFFSFTSEQSFDSTRMLKEPIPR